MYARLPRTTIAVFLLTAVITCVAYLHPPVIRGLERTPEIVASGEWWRLVSPILVNPDGWRQVTYNFCALAIVGTIAELTWGPRLWLLFYIVGGVTGEVAGLAWQPVGAGSSVAICGLLGAIAVWLLVRVGIGRARFGAFVILGFGLVLIHARDLHGPPILATALLAGIILRVRRRIQPDFGTGADGDEHENRH